MFAVVLTYPRSSTVAFQRRTKSGWEKLPIPNLPSISDFETIAKEYPLKERSNVSKSGIDWVRFQKSSFLVQVSGWLYTTPPLNVTLRYRLQYRDNQWTISKVSEDVVAE